MNRRVLQVLAVAWAVGLLGTYVACRSTSRETGAPPSPTSSDPDAAPPGDLRTFVGTKSAGVFEPADVENDPPPETQSSGFHPLPSSKSGRAFAPPPPQTGPVKREFRLMPGSKSAPVEISSPPTTAPAPTKYRAATPDWGEAPPMLLPGSKSGHHDPAAIEALFGDRRPESPSTQPATQPANPKQ